MLNSLVTADSGTVAYRIFGAVRINSLSVYSESSSTGGDVYLQWFSETGAQKLLSDSSTSTAFPPCLMNLKPPKDSLAGNWSVTGTFESDTLFILDSTLGTYVDLNLSVTLANDLMGGSVPTSTTISGGTQGVIGICAVDHSGSKTYVGIGWPTYA
jgi:hypothetical protein